MQQRSMAPTQRPEKKCVRSDVRRGWVEFGQRGDTARWCRRYITGAVPRMAWPDHTMQLVPMEWNAARKTSKKDKKKKKKKKKKGRKRCTEEKQEKKKSSKSIHVSNLSELTHWYLARLISAVVHIVPK